MNLRILRILVFKALYAHIFSGKLISQRENSEEQMLRQAEKTHHLYLTIHGLLVSVGIKWEQYCQRTKKEWASIFSKNFCYIKLAQDAFLAKQMRSLKINFLQKSDDYPEEIVKKLFQSSLPNAYLYAQKTIENQRRFMLHLLENFVAPNPKLHDFYDAQDLIYSEDYDTLSFANTAAKKTLLEIAENRSAPVVWMPVFKTKNHKVFMIELLKKSILHQKEILKILESYLTETWSFDRLSSVCQVILQLAATEMIYFDNIPKNSTITEYLYISREYLAPQEIGFINALLDNFQKNPNTPKKANL